MVTFEYSLALNLLCYVAVTGSLNIPCIFRLPVALVEGMIHFNNYSIREITSSVYLLKYRSIVVDGFFLTVLDWSWKILHNSGRMSVRSKSVPPSPGWREPGPALSTLQVKPIIITLQVNFAGITHHHNFKGIIHHHNFAGITHHHNFAVITHHHNFSYFSG